MSLPLPPAFVAGDIPSTWEDRGSQFFNEATKSSKAKPSVYTVKDVCGRDAYKKGGHSINISKLVNCVPVQVASLSLSARFSIGTTAEAMGSLLDAIKDELFDAMAA